MIKLIVILIKDKCAITLEKIYGAIPIIIHKIVSHKIKYHAIMKARKIKLLGIHLK